MKLTCRALGSNPTATANQSPAPAQVTSLTGKVETRAGEHQGSIQSPPAWRERGSAVTTPLTFPPVVA